MSLLCYLAFIKHINVREAATHQHWKVGNRGNSKDMKKVTAELRRGKRKVGDRCVTQRRTQKENHPTALTVLAPPGRCPGAGWLITTSLMIFV